MSTTLKCLEHIARLAEQSKQPLEAVLTVLRLEAQSVAAEQHERRSTPEERNIVARELAKLDEATLRHATSRDIAAELVERGVPIRPRTQGVLACISRQVKQLLLTFDGKRVQPAE